MTDSPQWLTCGTMAESRCDGWLTVKWLHRCLPSWHHLYRRWIRPPLHPSWSPLSPISCTHWLQPALILCCASSSGTVKASECAIPVCPVQYAVTGFVLLLLAVSRKLSLRDRAELQRPPILSITIYTIIHADGSHDIYTSLCITSSQVLFLWSPFLCLHALRCLTGKPLFQPD